MAKESIYEILDVAEARLQEAHRHARFGEWGLSAKQITRVHLALHLAAKKLDFDLDQEARNLLAEEKTDA